MEETKRCPMCKAYLWTDTHQCPPAWLVWLVDEAIDDAQTIYASRAESAAELWAARYDSDGDYEIVGGKSLRVFVRSAVLDEARTYEDTAPVLFEVSGETVPSYTATVAR
jgi:hypothetical protein